MTPQELVEHLLAQPDVEAQKRFLEAHASLLDDEVADALKEQADYFLRSDVQRSLEMADLLFYMTGLTGNLLYRALGLLAEANARSIGGLGEYQRAVALYDEAAEIYQAHGIDSQGRIGHLPGLADTADGRQMINNIGLYVTDRSIYHLLIRYIDIHQGQMVGHMFDIIDRFAGENGSENLISPAEEEFGQVTAGKAANACD